MQDGKLQEVPYLNLVKREIPWISVANIKTKRNEKPFLATC